MMNGKSMIITAVVIGVVGILGGMVWSAEKEKSKGTEANQAIAMATSAKITIEGAMKTALEKTPGKVIEAELEQRRDKILWKVEILTAEEAIMAVYVDAVSGSVMTTEEKMAGKKPIQDKKS
ncbi:MAG: PepSY domain-containing protein [Nitrospirae bacterium]|nr:PepSY domain-containing protein [Nitrospirota bacterium]